MHAAWKALTSSLLRACLPVDSAEGETANEFISHDLEGQGRKRFAVAWLPCDGCCSIIHISTLHITSYSRVSIMFCYSRCWADIVFNLAEAIGVLMNADLWSPPK